MKEKEELMLPTFVIGLREGLEAALIVGIIAAFLRQQGRKDLLRWVFVGVVAAVLLCVGAGVALNIVSKDLPQRQQEGMETIIGVLAIGMVTYMVVWMRRHSRELKGQLEGMAADAMDGGSRAARAMVLMAFLAVLREGIETVVFLLAIFNNSTSGADAPIGAVLGLLLALALGYGIDRGGVRLNLSKFFRATGLVLVFVAAGLVVNALHTAHEAGWLNSGQGSTIDLTWLVRPGSVQASLLTGMLGVQPNPVVIEVIGWLAYLIPVGCYVAWPPGRGMARRSVSRVLLGVGTALAATAVILISVAPGKPASGGFSPGSLKLVSSEVHAGIASDVYSKTVSGAAATTRQVTYAQLATLNGGNLPIGVHTVPGGTATVSTTETKTTTLWVEPRTRRVVDQRVVTKDVASLVQATGAIPLDSVTSTTTGSTKDAVASAAHAARHDLDQLDHRSVLTGLAWTAAVMALIALLASGAFGIAPKRRSDIGPAAVPTPESTLVRS
jgi:high-affinity iron transporter